MPRVLMNFQQLNDWVVHFVEADCKTTIGPRTRYFHLATEEEFRAFVDRCNLESRADYEVVCARSRAGRRVLQPYRRAVRQAQKLSIRRKYARHLFRFVLRLPMDGKHT
jgi:hypothetical protein